MWPLSTTDDPAFAATLCPILTSRKQERKWQGTLTGGNPQGAVEVDSVLLGRTRTNVLELTRKDLDRLYTNDGDLRDSIAAAFAGAQDEKTKLGKLLAAQGKTEFRTNKGRLVHKVTLKRRRAGQFLYQTDRRAQPQCAGNERILLRRSLPRHKRADQSARYPPHRCDTQR